MTIDSIAEQNQTAGGKEREREKERVRERKKERKGNNNVVVRDSAIVSVVG
jgi:hypothetical protein